MKKTRIAVLIVASMAGIHAAGAQVVLPDKHQPTGLHDHVFGLGLFGGAATGFGLSFRHHLPGSFSYQLTGGIIKIDNRLSYDIGAEGQYDLVRTTSSRFFVAGGAGHYYSGKSGTNSLKAPTRYGFGVGGEFAMTPGLHTMVEALFTFFSDGTILPLPQLGFHYYFY